MSTMAITATSSSTSTNTHTHLNHTATLSSRRDAHAPVPLLLSAFPAPPTHIPGSPIPLSPVVPSQLGSPPNPFSSNSASGTGNGGVNPPPTRAPAMPLPPLPRTPSAISERDTLAFMSGVNKSVRSSITSESLRSSLSSSGGTTTSTSLTSPTSTAPSPSHISPLTPRSPYPHPQLNSQSHQQQLPHPHSRPPPTPTTASQGTRTTPSDILTQMLHDELGVTGALPSEAVINKRLSREMEGVVIAKRLSSSLGYSAAAAFSPGLAGGKGGV
ncbi:hypothetical protein BD410DRAFT_317279, partial [Rickenella mellea]